MNWLDLRQAINDIQLQLIVTIIFLIILGIAGIYFARRSHRKQRPKYTPMNHKIWLRIQRGDYQHKQVNKSWWSELLDGLSTELIGAVITTAILGIGVLIFTQYQAVQNRKAELILQMGSPDNAFAIEAVRQLRTLGWLEDGTLQDTFFERINLQGANLQDADLQGVIILNTNLQNANLQGANLQNADLLVSNLEFANVLVANLQNANLQDANLRGANLHAVLLQETILQGATLPDGTIWAEDIDMGRFTDPYHPNFWNPCIEINPTPWYCY